MAETKKPIEVVEEIKTASEVSTSDMDKALNTKGFAEFLAMHPDAKTLDLHNEKEVTKRFEVFQIKEEVKKSIKSLYKGEIQRDMGITLETNDLDAVDTHLEKMAIEDPKEMSRMIERIAKFQELPKKIAELEGQIAAIGKSEDLLVVLEKKRKLQTELGIARKYAGIGGTAKYALMHLKVGFKGLSNLEEMLSKKLNPTFDLSDQAKEFVGDLDRTKTERAAVKSVRENIGSSNKGKIETVLSSVESDISEIESLLEAMTNLEDMKKASEKSFNSLRKKLMGGVSEIAEVKDAVQNCAKKQLQEMLKGNSKGETSIDSLNETQTRFEELVTASETTKTGIDPLEKVDMEKYQEAIDAAIQGKAFEQIVKTVNDTNLGNNALTKMEKVLQPFLTEEKLGSLDANETKKFVADSIKEAADNLGDTTEGKAKRFILSRILIKIGK